MKNRDTAMPFPEKFQVVLRPLCDDGFPRLSFAEKKCLLDALHDFLETGAGRKCFRAGFPEELFARRGESRAGGRDPGPDAGERVEPVLPGLGCCTGPCTQFPGCLGRPLMEIARTDPFPRVRRAAVRVMIRFKHPILPDARLEDYLPGLLSRNPVFACAVLRFIVEHFGPGSLKWVIVYLDYQGRRFPPLMLRMLEGLCEEVLRGLDAQWMLMQLRRRCLKEPQDPAQGGVEPWEAEILGALQSWEYARIGRATGRPAGPGPGAPAPRRTRSPATGHKVDRPAREGFQRIRSRKPRPL